MVLVDRYQIKLKGTIAMYWSTQNEPRFPLTEFLVIYLYPYIFHWQLSLTFGEKHVQYENCPKPASDRKPKVRSNREMDWLRREPIVIILTQPIKKIHTLKKLQTIMVTDIRLCQTEERKMPSDMKSETCWTCDTNQGDQPVWSKRTNLIIILHALLPIWISLYGHVTITGISLQGFPG